MNKEYNEKNLRKIMDLKDNEKSIQNNNNNNHSMIWSDIHGVTSPHFHMCILYIYIHICTAQCDQGCWSLMYLCMCILYIYIHICTAQCD